MIKKIETIARQSIALNENRAFHDASWYAYAGEICACLDADFSLPAHTSAGFIAALSPLNSWESQLKFTPPSLHACQALLASGADCWQGIRGPGFFSNKHKAARILQGESPLDVLSGDKVRAFYLNLIGDFSVVTIDRHALAIAGWDKSLTSKAYNRLSFAYKAAGENLGISGAEIQALTWNYWRRAESAFSEANKRREAR